MSDGLEVVADEIDGASSKGSGYESSALASRYSSISSGMSGLFMKHRELSLPRQDVSLTVPPPASPALSSPSLLPTSDPTLPPDDIVEGLLTTDPATREHNRVEQWLEEQHGEQQQLGVDEEVIEVSEVQVVHEVAHAQYNGAEEEESEKDDDYYGGGKEDISDDLSGVSSHPYLAYPDLARTPIAHLKIAERPFESAASITSYVIVDDDDEYRRQSPSPILSSGSLALGRGRKPRRSSYDPQPTHGSPWRSLRLRRSYTFLSSLTSSSATSPIKAFNELIRTESRHTKPFTPPRTPRNSDSSLATTPLFRRSPIPHIFLSVTPDRSESPHHDHMGGSQDAVADELITPKASRTRPRKWHLSGSTKSDLKPMRSLATPFETRSPLMSLPRLSTSTEGTYVSSFQESNASGTNSSPSPSLSSVAKQPSRFSFALRHLSRVPSPRNQEHPQQTLTFDEISKCGSGETFLRESSSPSITASTKQPRFNSLLDITVPTLPALRSPSVSTKGTMTKESDCSDDNESLSRLSCPNSFRHVRAGSQSTTSTSTSISTSISNLPLMRSSVETACNAVDSTSRILRDLAIYSNSSDVPDQSVLDLEVDAHCTYQSSTHIGANRSPSKYSMPTRKLAAGLTSTNPSTGTLMSMPKSVTNSRRKKLIVSGVTMDDEVALVGVRKWCESFGEVRCMTRVRSGELHVDFKSADVADTVCRLRAQVYITGVGSVGLSWYTGKRPL